MNDLSFRPVAAPLPLSKLAAHLAAPVPASADPSRPIAGVASLDRAGPDEVAAYVEGDEPAELRDTRAGVCLVAACHLAHVPRGAVALVTADPLEALRRAASLIHPRSGGDGPIFDRKGVDPAAVVHREAELEQGVAIDPGVVVGPRAEIGSATTVGANTVVGAGVRIGRGCTIDAQVSIRCALIGDRVTIDAGARIGCDDAAAAPLLGRVIIQDGASIGANAVVSRGYLRDTTIGEGARVEALAIVRPDTTLGRGKTQTRTRFPPAREMG